MEATIIRRHPSRNEQSTNMFRTVKDNAKYRQNYDYLVAWYPIMFRLGWLKLHPEYETGLELDSTPVLGNSHLKYST